MEFDPMRFDGADPNDEASAAGSTGRPAFDRNGNASSSENTSPHANLQDPFALFSTFAADHNDDNENLANQNQSNANVRAGYSRSPTSTSSLPPQTNGS